MKKTLVSAAMCGALLWAPTIASASPEAVAVIQKMQQREKARSVGTRAYATVEANTMGHGGAFFYERMHHDLGFRMILPDEMSLRVGAAAGGISQQAFADILMMIALGIMDDIGSAGGLGDGAKAAGMLGAFGFAHAVIATDLRAGDEEKEAFYNLIDIENYAEKADLINIQVFNGRQSYALFGDDLNLNSRENGSEYTISSAELYIDTELDVINGMIFRGVSTDLRTKSQWPLEIIVVNEDFQKIKYSNILLPRLMRTSLTIDIYTDAQKGEQEQARKDLAEVKVQMAKFEAEIAMLPLPQQAMMRQMVGDKLQTAMQMSENAIEGKPIEMEHIVLRAEAMPDLAAFQIFVEGYLKYMTSTP